MNSNRLPWPGAATFGFGDAVQRGPMNGKPPAYRFPGRVIGWYSSPVSSGIGYAVSLDGDPGCVQIFPEYMLEARYTGRGHCRALQQSDEMFCARCNLRWDVNDASPPRCLVTGRI